jgi:hypothetical protein
VRWRNITVSRPSLPEVENNQLSSRGLGQDAGFGLAAPPTVYSPNAKISKSSVRAESHHQLEAENTLGYLRALGFMIATGHFLLLAQPEANVSFEARRLETILRTV